MERNRRKMLASGGWDLTGFRHWRSQCHEIDRRSMSESRGCKLLKRMNRFSVCGFEGMWKMFHISNARVAQLVEYNLAKVGVAGSSPVSRSHN